jgi:hypothetical protein
MRITNGEEVNVYLEGDFHGLRESIIPAFERTNECIFIVLLYYTHALPPLVTASYYAVGPLMISTVHLTVNICLLANISR